MEIVLSYSTVLSSMDEDLKYSDPGYILINYKSIFPDYEIIDDLKQQFVFMVNKQLNKITDQQCIKMLLLLHKYDVLIYYIKLIEHVIWRFLRLETNPKHFCSYLIDPIKDDIIHFSHEFTGILTYLIKGSVYQNDLSSIKAGDFVFSMNLLKFCPFIKYDTYIDLEYAIQYGIIDVIDYVCKNYKCQSNRTICELACLYRQFELVKLMFTPENPINMANAAFGGDIEIIKWLHKSGAGFDITVCSSAAMGGNLEILKWLRGMGCPWDSSVCENAVLYGHTDVFIWAYENGCPMNRECCLVLADSSTELTNLILSCK